MCNRAIDYWWPFGRVELNPLGSVFCALLFCCASSISANAAVPACAAYSKSGQLAQVMLSSGQIVVQLFSAGSNIASKLYVSPVLPVTGCNSFFSQDEALLAIGLNNDRNPKQHVQIVVVDVRDRKLLQTIPMVLRLAVDSRGQLQGFIANTHKVLVMNSGAFFKDESATTVFPVTVDLIEGTVTTAAMAAAGSSVSETNSIIDPAENLIWLRDRRNICSLRPFEIDSAEDSHVTDMSTKILRFGCSLADLLIAAPSKSMLQFSRDGDQTLVRRIDWETEKFTELRFGGASKDGVYLPRGEWAISPDGRVIAVEALHIVSGKLGAISTKRELVIISVNSLAVLSTMPLDYGAHAIAIYNSDAEIKLSFLNGSNWETLLGRIGPSPISWSMCCESALADH
jgi:hypothetical protein